MIRTIVLTVVASFGFSHSTLATPDDDRAAFTTFFNNRFSNVETAEYINGIYALDSAQPAQWQEIEEFPPYDLDIDARSLLYQTPFPNGKSYASCFESETCANRSKYTKWDTKKEKFVTLGIDMNNCRVANGEEPLKYKG